MLIEVLRSESVLARKAKMKGEGSAYVVNLLTTLVGECTRIGKDASPPRETADSEVLAHLRKTLKTQEEMREIVERRAADGTSTRADEIRQVDEEIAYLGGFLDRHQPKQLSEDEITAEIVKVRQTKPDAKVGDVMAHLKANFPGRYDGKTASRLAASA